MCFEKKEKIFDLTPQGSGGRWAFGTIILIHLIIYNETNGPTGFCSTLLAAFYGFIYAICKSGLNNVQISYIRASNKFDFVCLFLAFWMDTLATLTACATLARVLSTCLDTMTGGLARVLILGRNSTENEPWPDVLGVGVVFIITAMFMLGLENTNIFGIIMTISMLGISAIISLVSYKSGNNYEWKRDFFVPNGLNSFLTATALSCYSYPNNMPNKQGLKKLYGLVLIIFVCISSMLAAYGLSTIVKYKPEKEYVVVPLFKILQEKSYVNLVPASACLLLLSCSIALIELFEEIYKNIVRLSTVEWKILLKQITYESPESGNPILAIFITGSLCAMLAFACPLQNLIYVTAASHICSGLIRAFYCIYTPFRPKYVMKQNETSLTYSRLSTSPPENETTEKSKASWNFNISSIKKKKKNVNKNEIEKEWLLLGEPSSPCPIQQEKQVTSTLISDIDSPVSDFECPEGRADSNSENSDSEDIDAIVDEYRQKIKVTTAGMEKNIKVPTLASWRVTILAIIVITLGIILMIFGIHFRLLISYIAGFLGIFIVSIMMSFIPKYTSGNTGDISPIISSISLTFGSILLYACLQYSWPAILFWITAGLTLLMRCSYSCCDDQLMAMDEQLIPKSNALKTRKIRLPRPPKNFIIPGRIISHNYRSEIR